MIAWLDLETTGLDPKRGSIFEIAMIITDDDLREVSRFTSLVKPLHLRGLEATVPFVMNMHEKSGLLAELYDQVELRPGLPRPGEVELAAIWWLEGATVACATAVLEPLPKFLRSIPLGGNSVHFDRAWLKEHMPDLEAVFSHRNVDCSTVNEMAKRWAPKLYEARPGAEGEPKHRALDDVLGSIELARFYREEMFDRIDRSAFFVEVEARTHEAGR